MDGSKNLVMFGFGEGLMDGGVFTPGEGAKSVR